MRPDGTQVVDLAAPNGAADASWSPDGQLVAFEADPDGGGDFGDLEIFVMKPDGTGLRQVTHSPGPDLWPDWFPVGKRLAFTSFRAGAPNIYAIDADGTDEQALTDETEFGSVTPAVSPDGTQIVFSRDSQTTPPDIWVMDSDGTDQHALRAPDPFVDQDPQWSPDGTRIVFDSNRFGSVEIFVMNADGSGRRALTNNPGADIAPTFSPNGQQIAWTKLIGPNGDVWIMNADGSGETPITTTPTTFEGFPDWH